MPLHKESLNTTNENNEWPSYRDEQLPAAITRLQRFQEDLGRRAKQDPTSCHPRLLGKTGVPTRIEFLKARATGRPMRCSIKWKLWNKYTKG